MNATKGWTTVLVIVNASTLLGVSIADVLVALRGMELLVLTLMSVSGALAAMKMLFVKTQKKVTRAHVAQVLPAMAGNVLISTNVFLELTIVMKMPSVMTAREIILVNVVLVTLVMVLIALVRK